MNDMADGSFEILFGVSLEDKHHCEACPGTVLFSQGKLVCIRVGGAAGQKNPDGLTAGFIQITEPSPLSEQPGFATGRAIEHIYVKGVLDSSNDLGDILFAMS